MVTFENVEGFAEEVDLVEAFGLFGFDAVIFLSDKFAEPKK